MPGVYRIAVTCEDLGRRVTVRYRLSAGTKTDVVGILESCDDRAFGIRDRGGRLRRVLRADIVAAKVVPPATR